MGLPEYVVQYGVQRAWDIVKKSHNRHLGLWLKEFPVDKQERYRKMLRDEGAPYIHIGFPENPPRLPSFSIILRDEHEHPQGQYLGHGGITHGEPLHPMSDNDGELPWVEPFYGVTYPGEHKTYDPTLVTVDGGRKGLSTGFVPGKNPDPFYEDMDYMGHPQRLYDESAVHLESEVTGFEMNMGILVTTTNSEKTIVYYRILQKVLLRFLDWFERNGLQNLKLSGADLSVNPNLTPSPGPVYQRMMNLNFFFQSADVYASQFIREMMCEMDMGVRRCDGTIQYTKLKFDVDLTGQGEDEESK